MGKTLVTSLCALALAGLGACGGSDDSSTAPAVSTLPVQPPTSTPDEPGNTAPHIAGNPITEGVAGQSYSFTPTATDADGDSLTFSISSKPGWASFNTATGQLWGTPATADVGSHEEIAISVTDGDNKQTLPQFAINVVEHNNGNVTLSWWAPIENTDDSPLTNLSGYKIHYGSQASHYTTTITLNNGGLTRYVIDNLARGTYFFVITALTASGAESDLSNEVSTTI